MWNGGATLVRSPAACLRHFGWCPSAQRCPEERHAPESQIDEQYLRGRSALGIDVRREESTPTLELSIGLNSSRTGFRRSWDQCMVACDICHTHRLGVKCVLLPCPSYSTCRKLTLQRRSSHYWNRRTRPMAVNRRITPRRSPLRE